MRIQHLENSTYALARSFNIVADDGFSEIFNSHVSEIGWKLHEMLKEEKQFVGLDIEKFSASRAEIDHMVSACIDPFIFNHSGITGVGNSKTRVKIEPDYSGIVSKIDKRYLAVMREILHRRPLFAEFSLIGRNILITNFLAVSGYIYPDGSRPPFYGGSLAPMFKVKSELIRDSIDIFPWKI